MTSVTIAGSTGSIGRQSLDVLASQQDGGHTLEAISAHSSVELLALQAIKYNPRKVIITDESLLSKLKDLLPSHMEVLAGNQALEEVASQSDITINAVVGFAALPVTLATLNAGKRLGLANKESLISAGPALIDARKIPGAEIIPIDSEHCAIHQCLRSSSNSTKEVSKLILTASGGPFRNKSRSELSNIKVQDALAHPTWDMGPKITIDSSTLMNKGLEVIEAHELFGVDYDQIEVIVHPQSIVHSMVEFLDGSTIAQLSLPDMRLPIGYALSFPNRFDKAFGPIDWTKLSSLEFQFPDYKTFPCLSLAYQAGRLGKSAPAWLNAANEVAVEAFLAEKINWLDIPNVIEQTLNLWDGQDAKELDQVLQADLLARQKASTIIDNRVDAV